MLCPYERLFRRRIKCGDLDLRNNGKFEDVELKTLLDECSTSTKIKLAETLDVLHYFHTHW